LLHLLYPELGTTVLPYELAAVDVLNQMASNDAVMTKSQAHSWACKAAGLDTDAIHDVNKGFIRDNKSARVET
jgi:hypothetical protein